jgi:hypothetical protein
MQAETLELASISWIDEKSLPKVGFWFVAGASLSWSRRVIMGLVGTSNPEPPTKLDTKAFATAKEYRALLACTAANRPAQKVANLVIDPGYTPPFDKSKLDTRLRDIVPIPEDQNFYAGEASPISAVVVGKLHPCSALVLPQEAKVIASALIKFRAGQHTDSVGITEAKSPVHVPWVWCEYALVTLRSNLQLLCNGSLFPSHAWYVNGRQIAKAMQSQVTVSDHDATLTTGQPAEHLRMTAISDKSAGSVSGQQYCVGAGKQLNIDLLSVLK